MTVRSLSAQFLSTGYAQVVADVRSIPRRFQVALFSHQTRPIIRWRNRIIALGVIGALLFLASAIPSFADDSKGGSAGSVWFNWLHEKDSYGRTPSDYDLRVKQGGITDVVTKFGALALGLFWDFYRIAVEVVVWGLGFVLQFKFLALVRAPANVVAEVIQNTIGQLGIISTIATVSALISAVWWFKGRAGAGLGEMAVTAVIAALMGTALANPVAMITGPDGAMAKAQQMGSAISANLLTTDAAKHASGSVGTGATKDPVGGGGQDPNTMVKDAATKRILDVFVRTPHELLETGMALDGPGVPKACLKAYNNAFPGGSIKPMTKVCPPVVKDTVEHPQKSLVGAPVISIALVLTGIFILILLGATGFLTGLAAFEAAKFSLVMLKAMFVGASRGALFVAIATVVVSLGLMVGAIVALAVYVLILTGIFDQTHGWNIVQIYLFIDIACFICCVMAVLHLFRAKKHGKRLGQKAGAALSPKPAAMPSPTRASMTQTAMRGARSIQAHRSQRQLAGALQGGGVGGGGGARELPAGGERRGLAKTVGRGAVKGTMLAAKGAIGATIGAPVAIPRAVQATKTAVNTRRAMLNTKASLAKGSIASRKQPVQNYMAEYKNNVQAAGRGIKHGAAGVAHGTQVVGAAMTGTPLPPKKNTANNTTDGVARLNNLRSNLGQQPITRTHQTKAAGPDPRLAAIGVGPGRGPAGTSRPPQVAPATRPAFGRSDRVRSALQADMEARLASIPRKQRPSPRAASWQPGASR